MSVTIHTIAVRRIILLLLGVSHYSELGLRAYENHSSQWHLQKTCCMVLSITLCIPLINRSSQCYILMVSQNNVNVFLLVTRNHDSCSYGHT